MFVGSGTQGLELGVVVSLRDQFSLTADSIRRNMVNLGITAEWLENKFGKAFDRLGRQFAYFGASMGVLIPFKNAITEAVDFKQFHKTFEILLGGYDKADSMMGNLKQFALKFPQFDFKQSLEYTKQFMARGIGADKVLEDLKRVGDVASVLGMEKLPQIAYAYGEVAAKGKLFSSELNVQFGSAGVPLREYLAKLLGVTVQDFSARFNSGKADQIVVSFEQVRQAFDLMTKGGGRFEDAMNRTAYLTKGQWLMLKDTLQLAMVEIGLSVEGTVNLVMQGLVKVALVFKDFVTTPLGKVIANVVFWTAAMTAAVMAFRITSTLLRITTFYYVETASRYFSTFARNVLYAAKNLYAFVTIQSVSAFSDGLNSIGKVLTSFGTKFLWVIGIASAFAAAFKFFGGSAMLQNWQVFWDGLSQAFYSLDDKGNFSLSEPIMNKLNEKGLLGTLTGLMNKLYAVKMLFKGFFEGAVSGFSTVYSAFESIFSSMGFKSFSTFNSANFYEVGKGIGTVIGGLVGIVTVAMLLIIKVISKIFDTLGAIGGTGSFIKNSTMGSMLTGGNGVFGALYAVGKGLWGAKNTPVSPNTGIPSIPMDLDTQSKNVGNVFDPVPKSDIFKINPLFGTRGNQNSGGLKLDVKLDLDGETLHRKLILVNNLQNSRTDG